LVDDILTEEQRRDGDLEMGSYTPGQVARMLGSGVSSHRIRRLCESGVLAAELTDGNRWQIPASEVERLQEWVKREGDLPPVPQAEIQTSTRRRPNAAPQEEEDSEDADEGPETGATASPAVQSEADSLSIAEKRLKRRRVELETEEVEDGFRAREGQRLAAQEEQRRAEVQEQRRQARKRWVDTWARWGMSLVSSDVPAECRLEAHEEIQRTLNDLRSDQSEEILRDLVRAAVSKTLAPYQRRQQLFGAMKQAFDLAGSSLPWGTSDEYRAKARQAATDAVIETSKRMGDLATPLDFSLAANAAVQPIAAAVLRQKRVGELEVQKTRVIEGFWPGFLDASERDREDGAHAVREAFSGISDPETTRDSLEKIRDKALAPYKARIAARKEKEAARIQTESTVDQCLRHVDKYLRDNYEFDAFSDRWQAEREFKAELRPEILKRLTQGKLALANVEEFIEDWIDEEMEEDEEDLEDEETDEEEWDDEEDDEEDSDDE
jgi:hypothetical protein